MLDLTFRKPETGPAAASSRSLGVPDVGAVSGSQPAPVAVAPPPNPAGRRPAGVGEIRGLQFEQGADRVFGLASLAALGVVLVTGVIASFLVAQNVGAAERASEQAAALQAQLRTGETGAALSKIQLVSRQLSTFQSFLADATPWSELLAAFSATVPGSLQLTNATFTNERTVRLDGEARDYQTVATFIAALRSTDAFTNPQLLSVALNESVEGTALVFSLATEYVPKAVQPDQESSGDNNGE